MATIYDYVNAKAQAKRWEESPLERPPYLGVGLSTSQKILGTEFSSLSGRVSAPKILNASSYDAKVIYLPREGFSVTKGEIPYFKNALMINEKQRQELLKVIATGDSVLINAVVTIIFNDNKTLFEAAGVTKEQLRMMLLTTGKIAIANNGQVWEYDFGIPASNKIASDWTAADADPINDIIEAQDAVQTTFGVRPTNILMNTSTFISKIAKNTNIINALNANSIRVVVPRRRDIEQYVQDETMSTLYLYDDVYKDLNGNTVKFVPDDVVVLFPDGQPIEEFFGTTPEEADLMAGTDADVVIVDDVTLTTCKEVDPVNVRTKVSMSYIPTLKEPNSIVIMDVKKQ